MVVRDGEHDDGVVLQDHLEAFSACATTFPRPVVAHDDAIGVRRWRSCKHGGLVVPHVRGQALDGGRRCEVHKRDAGIELDARFDAVVGHHDQSPCLLRRKAVGGNGRGVGQPSITEAVLVPCRGELNGITVGILRGDGGHQIGQRGGVFLPTHGHLRRRIFNLDAGRGEFGLSGSIAHGQHGVPVVATGQGRGRKGFDSEGGFQRIVSVPRHVLQSRLVAVSVRHVG